MLLPVRGRLRHYAWGSPTRLYDLLGRAPGPEPAAELWLGTHPEAVAEVVVNGRGRPATQIVGELPWLLKVIAADAPLSLQVHPDRPLAEAGHRLGRYGDPNHKPELLVALTAVRALVGLRPAGRSSAIVEALGGPALAALARPLGDDPEGGPAAVLRALLALPPGDRSVFVREVVAAAATVDPAADEPVRRAASLVERLAAAHPGDVGVVAALLLNDVTLAPGRGLYVAPRTPHAYVEGYGIEIMATSDNVDRAALTAKAVDVAAFVRVVDGRPTEPPIVDPVALLEAPGATVRTWPVPVPDFALLEIECRIEAGLEIAGPAILLCLEGSLECALGGPETLTVRRGGAALAAGSGRLTVRGAGRLFVARSGG